MVSSFAGHPAVEARSVDRAFSNYLRLKSAHQAKKNIDSNFFHIGDSSQLK